MDPVQLILLGFTLDMFIGVIIAFIKTVFKVEQLTPEKVILPLKLASIILFIVYSII